ncbi:MAG: YcxB family protein [Methylophilaceae bacterium]
MAYWQRTVGLGFVAAKVLINISLAILLFQGNASWIVVLLASVLFVGILFIAAIYFVHMANSMRTFRAIGKPQATFTTDENTFSFSSVAGQSMLPWQSIRDVCKFPTFWLLLFSKAQFATLPSVNLPNEIQQLIVKKVRSNGGKIR